MPLVQERHAEPSLSQLALTQKLQKLEGEAKDNQERIDHWSTEHDKLRLEDIESVVITFHTHNRL